MPTDKKPFVEPSISPPSDVLEAAKKYPIMGFIGPGSGTLQDTGDISPADGFDPDTGGPGDFTGDQPVVDGGGGD